MKQVLVNLTTDDGTVYTVNLAIKELDFTLPNLKEALTEVAHSLWEALNEEVV